MDVDDSKAAISLKTPPECRWQLMRAAALEPSAWLGGSWAGQRLLSWVCPIVLPQQFFMASLTQEKDPGEAEFRFPRLAMFVYLLGFRCAHSLLKGVFLFRGNPNTRRQKLGPREMLVWFNWVTHLFHLFPMAKISFHYTCSRPTFKNKSIYCSF